MIRSTLGLWLAATVLSFSGHAAAEPGRAEESGPGGSRFSKLLRVAAKALDAAVESAVETAVEEAKREGLHLRSEAAANADEPGEEAAAAADAEEPTTELRGEEPAEVAGSGWKARVAKETPAEAPVGRPAPPSEDDEAQEVATENPTEDPAEEEAEKTDRAAEEDDEGYVSVGEKEAEKERGFPPELVRLRRRIQYTLDWYFYNKPPSDRANSHWEVMHLFLPYGVHAKIRVGDERINAIAWACANRPCRGQPLLTLSRDRIVPRIGVGLQGHHGQFLAMLAQCRVDRNYKLHIDGQEKSIMDLVRSEQLTCEPNSELTFKLMAFAYYLDSDATWKDVYNRNWSIPRLIQEEIKQPIRIVKVTCGGTHRLTALSFAYQHREKQGKPIDGQFARAKKFVEAYQRYALGMQNPDGSLSTEWLRGKGNRNDVVRKVQTTGHQGEWLAYSLSTENLKHPKFVNVVRFLTDTLIEGRNRDWNPGHLGHALNAIAIFERRVFNDDERYVPGTYVARYEASRGEEATGGDAD